VLAFLYCSSVVIFVGLKSDNVFFGDRSSDLIDLADYIYYFFLAMFVWGIFKDTLSTLLFLLSLLTTRLVFWLAKEIEKIEKIIIFSKDFERGLVKTIIN